MRAQGFTLVELLAAMVAAALLVLALGSVTAGLSARLAQVGRADAAPDAAADAAAFVALVQRAIPTAEPGHIVSTRERVLFPIAAPQALVESEPMLAELVVEGSAPEKHVVLRLLSATTGQPIAGSDTIIFNDMAAIDLDADIERAGAGDTGLRRLSLHLVTRNGDRSLRSASPHVSVRPGCRFDPISLTCRPE